MSTQKYLLPNGTTLHLPRDLPQETVNDIIGRAMELGSLPGPSVPPTLAETTTKGYRNLVEPVTQAAAGPLGFLANPYIAAARGLMQGAEAPPPTTTWTGMQAQGRPLAEAVLPQTPAELGLALGTGGAGGVAARLGLRAAKAGLARIAGGTGGAIAGGLVSEEGAVLGGAKGLLGTVGGEVVLGKGVELARRAITNLTGGLYAADAKAIGRALGDLVPTLAGATGAKALRDLTISGTGRTKLLDRLSAGYDTVKMYMGDPVQVPSLGGAMSFDAARKELRNLFQQGWGPPNIQTLPSKAVFEARDRFAAGRRELEAEIVRLGNLQQLRGAQMAGLQGPPGGLTQGNKALSEFLAARKEFRIGMNLLDMIQRANGGSNRLFAPSPSGVLFQTNVLQGSMSAKEATLRKRLGEAEYDAIAKEVFRGAGPGAGDVPGVSFGRLFTRQQTPGGAMYERFPLTSIPGYAGTPHTIGQGKQALLDILLGLGLGKTPQLNVAGPQ